MLALFATSATAQTVYFVDDSSTAPAPNGLSWVNAFRDLQDALEVATKNDTILLAEGVYSPNPTNLDSRVFSEIPIGGTSTPRHYSFIFKKPTKIVGGFIGFGGTSDPNSPDGSAAATIVTGDTTGTPLNLSDNSHHVFFINGASLVFRTF